MKMNSDIFLKQTNNLKCRGRRKGVTELHTISAKGIVYISISIIPPMYISIINAKMTREMRLLGDVMRMLL